MKERFLTQTTMVCCLLLWSLVCFARPADFHLSIDGNTMSIHAHNVPLQDILQELENAGIKVRAKACRYSV